MGPNNGRSGSSDDENRSGYSDDGKSWHSDLDDRWPGSNNLGIETSDQGNGTTHQTIYDRDENVRQSSDINDRDDGNYTVTRDHWVDQNVEKGEDGRNGSGAWPGRNNND